MQQSIDTFINWSLLVKKNWRQNFLKIFFGLIWYFEYPVYAYKSRVRVKRIEIISNVRKRMGRFAGCNYRIVSFSTTVPSNHSAITLGRPEWFSANDVTGRLKLENVFQKRCHTIIVRQLHGSSRGSTRPFVWPGQRSYFAGNAIDGKYG